MNWELIKHKLCRLIATTAIASVVLLNAVCGILLGTPSRTAETVLPASHSRPAVQLQVVRGGHAA